MHKVFEDVAKSYDLMNDAMSMGIHRIWKDMFIERLGPAPGTRLLDMAGGTGDISFRYLKYLQNQPNPQGKKSHVTISDINQHMLDVGEERARKLGLTQEKLPNISIEWKCANAEELPFEDNTFNAYTIAFGIRNCTHIDKVFIFLPLDWKRIIPFILFYRFYVKLIVFYSLVVVLCVWNLVIWKMKPCNGYMINILFRSFLLWVKYWLVNGNLINIWWRVYVNFLNKKILNK